MKASEIIEAVRDGKRKIYWSNYFYECLNDKKAGLIIRAKDTGYCTGLTWSDGVTLNGKPEDFIIGPFVDLSPQDSVIDMVYTEGPNCPRDLVQLKNGWVIGINDESITVSMTADDEASGNTLADFYFSQFKK